MTIAVAESATTDEVSLQATSDPLHPVASHREQFIPIRKLDLVRLIASHGQLSSEQLPKIERFYQILAAYLHFNYHAHLETLKNLYSFYDPDRDTQVLPTLETQPPEDLNPLFEAFRKLLERANFIEMNQASIELAMNSASEWGVNLTVNFGVFDRLLMFARGDCVGNRSVRRWWRFFRLEDVPVAIYKRLIVMFRLKEEFVQDSRVDTHSVYIKMFKDIPKDDLEMLLPGTEFRMTLFEKGQIALPSVSGVAMTVYKVFLAVAFPFWWSIMLIGGTIGYAVKSYQGYLTTRQKYQLTLAQSLYYQNLDNNAGVIARLVDDAEEQEFRETVLAYYGLLLNTRDGAGWDVGQLDRWVEEFLDSQTGVKLDFEADDAVDKLIRFHLVESPTKGNFVAVPLDEALYRLDKLWDGVFEYHQ